MNASIRFMLALVLVTAALAGIGLSRPGWVEGLGLVWRPDVKPRGSCPVEDESDVVARRIVARTEIIRRLIDREMTLFDAASWFRILNETPAHRPQMSWKKLPGGCDNEKVCRQVLLWARVHLRDTVPSSQAKATLAALESELSEHIARNGKVNLPGSEEE
jgi:hypothetical protein